MTTLCTRCTHAITSCRCPRVPGATAPVRTRTKRRTPERDRALREALAFIPSGAEYDGLREVAKRHIGKKEAA